jgi:hypothetical protein
LSLYFSLYIVDICAKKSFFVTLDIDESPITSGAYY